MRGDGPPFIKIGRCVRYGAAALQEWAKSQNQFYVASIKLRNNARFVVTQDEYFQ